MKLLLPLVSLAALASARCTSKCSGACLRAVAGIPDGGAEPFCSSWLGLSPAAAATATTTVVVVGETVTSSAEKVETATTVLTRVSTVTTALPTATVYQRRDSAEDATAASVLAQCVNLPARVSSACSCIVSTTASLSPVTVTVLQTSTAVANVENTSTETVTVTTDEVAVTTTTPVRTIPSQPIINSDFESSMASDTTGILPWVASTGTTGGTVQYITGVNPCTTSSCSGGSHVIRVYPPSTGSYKYTAVSQEFDAKPSTTYSFSYYYRCLNFDTNSNVATYYNGALIGIASCSATPGAAFAISPGVQFTTDASGRGTIEVRLNNGGATPYLYAYLDDFRALPVV